jgi:hypothetical protein
MKQCNTPRNKHHLHRHHSSPESIRGPPARRPEASSPYRFLLTPHSAPLTPHSQPALPLTPWPQQLSIPPPHEHTASATSPHTSPSRAPQAAPPKIGTQQHTSARPHAHHWPTATASATHANPGARVEHCLLLPTGVDWMDWPKGEMGSRTAVNSTTEASKPHTATPAACCNGDAQQYN